MVSTREHPSDILAALDAVPTIDPDDIHAAEYAYLPAECRRLRDKLAAANATIADLRAECRRLQAKAERAATPEPAPAVDESEPPEGYWVSSGASRFYWGRIGFSYDGSSTVRPKAVAACWAHVRGQK
jgi:hypothetical protein